jgi:hypothetical protein
MKQPLYALGKKESGVYFFSREVRRRPVQGILLYILL